ncbi:uncharacterized protein LACBIDRAFT_296209 [Laccaria bicolor S238N-H82]|uniref:Predicted protein n=1 Tax=Laccaria bicolor (strain S238N-H82 / ATCC MYA-4686) TaxID=486041 RepID=B0D884_LACBS|nr:uncharacterized protein LACBIDRAFT_296209 [Laccaria bicolor S238N-H82]EDR08789.1 predicted protein [Laccaria bicolor S238N-H82]|eukprot:XP_001880102.1 predicted protein [Laccaria bicolor S238N-H82]
MDTITTTATSASSSPTSVSTDAVSARHASPVIAFIIGLAIILLASVLNAAGLNLTKLDHVRTSAVPKGARKKDWMRPLWLLGILLYILSQLIGSTLALEYMRAEYVAPLGSSSLVFNFLFARFLVGTPVTSTDVYGTIVVVLGVVGIVAFGSINSGLSNGTDVEHITRLWRRGGWLGFFFAMAFALFCVLVFTSRLDAVLAARADLEAVPFSSTGTRPGVGLGLPGGALSGGGRRKSLLGRVLGVFGAIKHGWYATMDWVTEHLETWAAPKDDKQVAWTLGIGWACCGGGLAGGCLVFAKATVKLLSGSLSHQNPGNQFGHAAPIFTILLLALTAVLQIICLNRGLKVYDSTLVVPVFYGVYTATGFLDSLIFNNEVDSYKSWTLFLIFLSISVLISGVVLLTHKKPEPVTGKTKSATPRPRQRRKVDKKTSEEGGELEGEQHGEGESSVLWAVGEASDGEEDLDEDEDLDHHQHPLGQLRQGNSSRRNLRAGREGVGLIDREEGGDLEVIDRYSHKTEDVWKRRSMDPFRDDTEQELGGSGVIR